LDFILNFAFRQINEYGSLTVKFKGVMEQQPPNDFQELLEKSFSAKQDALVYSSKLGEEISGAKKTGKSGIYQYSKILFR
jgi:hypothetical protein